MIRALVRCDGAHLTPALVTQDWTHRPEIVSMGPAATHTLRIENLAEVVLANLAPRCEDLLRIAAYTYAADQELPRGGNADIYDEAWRRQIHMCIPVRDPQFWQASAVREPLAAVLDFATGDTWEFHFSPAQAPSSPLYLAADHRRLLGRPDSVVLFSGGADSLCAAVQAVALQGARPVLVSHRSSPLIDARQQRLVEQLRRRFPDWRFPPLSLWVHRRQTDARSTTQRARAFLFASLGAVVASQLELERVVLADNGVVSINLPLNRGVLGTQASRSTHPRFLAGFNDFVRQVLPRSPQVENPLQIHTRAETLAILQSTQSAPLLEHTVSCSHPRGRTSAQPQCGFCTQCVDRRFGAIAAGLEAHDPADRYELDIFTQALPEGEPRTVAVDYVRLARRLHQLGGEQLFEEFPQLFDCLLADDPSPSQTAAMLTTLLKRHAENVLGALGQMVGRHRQALAARAISPTSLLPLVIGSDGEAASTSPALESNVFRQETKLWYLAYARVEARLPDRIGLHYIQYLLRRPHQGVVPEELVTEGRVDSATTLNGDVTSHDTAALATLGVHPASKRPQQVLDSQARANYRRERKRLEAEVATAQRSGDSEAAAEAQRELEQLEALVRQATGLGGRSRSFASLESSAHAKVRRAIERAFEDVAGVHPRLAAHLRDTVKRSIPFSYEPDSPISWLT